MIFLGEKMEKVFRMVKEVAPTRLGSHQRAQRDGEGTGGPGRSRGSAQAGAPFMAIHCAAL